MFAGSPRLVHCHNDNSFSLTKNSCTFLVIEENDFAVSHYFESLLSLLISKIGKGEFMEQVGLIPSGVNPYTKKSVIATPELIIYCSTIAVYVHQRVEGYPLLRVLTGPTSPMISFSVNDEVVVAVTPNDAKLFMWSLRTGELYANVPQKLFGGSMIPVSVAASPNCKGVIVVGCDDGSALIWHYSEGRSYPLSLSGVDGPVETCRFSTTMPSVVAFGSNNGMVHFYDVVKMQLKCQLDVFENFREGGFFEKVFGDSPRIADVAFDAHSTTYAVVAAVNGYMALVDIDKAVVVQNFERAPSGIACLCWLPSQPGSFLSVDSKTNTVRHWNVSTKSPLQLYRPDQGALLAVSSIPPEHDRIVVALRSGAITVFHLNLQRTEMTTLPAHCETVFDCRFAHHDKNIFASASYDGTVKLFNLKTMTLQATIEVRRVVYCVDFSPDGKMIAAALGSGEIAVYTLSNQKEAWKKKLHSDIAWRVVWCLGEPGLLATAGKDGKTYVVAAQDGAVLRLYHHSRAVYGIEFDPHQPQQLAVGCHDNLVRVYNLAMDSPEPSYALAGHTKEVFLVSFNPLVKDLVATTSNDCLVRVWDTSSRNTSMCSATSKALSGHQDKVRGLMWSHAVPFLLFSGSWDCTIRMWDVRTATLLTTVKHHSADVYALSSHPKRPFIIASSSRDTTIRFWAIKSFAHVQLDAAIGILESCIEADPLKLLVQSPSLQCATAGNRSPCVSGASIVELNNQLKSAPTAIARLCLVADFFEFPFGALDVANCSKYIVERSNSNLDMTCTVQPIDVLSSVAEKNASQLALVRNKISSSVGSSQRDAKLIQAAVEHMKLGKVREYCDLLVEAGQWERALSAAPLVGMEFWRSLCLRVADKLAHQGDVQAVDFYICAGEGHKAADFLANRGDYADAMIIVQTCPQRAESLAPDTTLVPQPPQVSAKVSQDKISAFARARSARYVAVGNPNLAAAACLSAGVADEAVMHLVRGASVPLAHQLIHCVPVSQGTIDAAFRNSMYLSVSRGQFASAAICASRQSERLMASATAFALASSLTAVFQNKTEKQQALEAMLAALDVPRLTPTSPLDKIALRTLQGDSAGVLRDVTEFIEDILRHPQSGTESLLRARDASNIVVAVPGDEVKPEFRRFFSAIYRVGVSLAMSYGMKHILPLMWTCVLHFCDVESDKAVLTSNLTAAAEQAATEQSRWGFSQRSPGSAQYVPLGARLPSASADERQVSSFITSNWIQGPQIVLENATSRISQEEGLEWNACCWFSPLATGDRLLPF